MRKTADFEVTDEGRDKGKVFRITEMAAIPASKWASRVLFAVAQAGVDLPAEVMAGGMASIPYVGLQALLHVNYATAEPLLDELLGCVQVKEKAVIRARTPDDIEEVATIFKLYGEVLKLHTGFSLAGDPSQSSPPAQTSNSSNTPTSTPSSDG